MNDDQPAINPTPYDPSTFSNATSVAVQAPWHHDPTFYFALALICFALALLVFAFSGRRTNRLETE